MTTRQDLQDQMLAVRLQGLSEHRGTVLEHAAPHHLDRLTTLSRLAALELEQRLPNAMALRWRPSTRADQLPMDQCDFRPPRARHAHKTRILHRLTLDVARAHMAVRLLGHPGAGPTCLATCLASAACHATIQVLLSTAIAMIHHRIAAAADHSLLKKLQYAQALELLVRAALGSVSLGQQGSPRCFQVMSGRHQRNAPVMTTTGPLADWGKVFDATPVATAIADRLGDHAAVRSWGGSSARRHLTSAYRGRPTSTGEPTGPNHHP
jgi:DNA replication protein DnaC